MMNAKSISRLTVPALAAAALLPGMTAADSYRDTVLKTAGMANDPEAMRLARGLGLDVLSLTWEDTGRFKNSAVGPNISDMTIQVAVETEPGAKDRTVHCMPVIRFPNFSDKTADVDTRKFFLLVGNERGFPTRRISLYEFLENPTLYLSDPGSWTGAGRRSLLAPKRDDKVLVSAQACFLPIQQEGTATFNPVLFNYQSVQDDPAVLTILATREGTSVTVIDNTRDAFEEGSAWGQRLFYNENGQRASLTGERASDFAKKPDPSLNPGQSPEAAGEKGLNMVLLIQVPLKQKNPMRFGVAPPGGVLLETASFADGANEKSDVENAVIGHGELEGPFTEIDGQNIERDPRFPVRVTVQFYKATSNGVVSESDLKDIRAQIDRVYDQGEYVGSLVTEGHTGRPTEYDGPKVQPADWWEAFWTRHEQNTGDDRGEAMRKLRKLLGDDFMERPADDGYLTTLLASTELPEGVTPRKAEKKKKGLLQKIFGK